MPKTLVVRPAERDSMRASYLLSIPLSPNYFDLLGEVGEREQLQESEAPPRRDLGKGVQTTRDPTPLLRGRPLIDVPKAQGGGPLHLQGKATGHG